ncbi:serine/threonine protein kinase [Mucilaginibacter sp. BJC16-A38]|uniref:serine/threonine protein kinase n=1 Tax=Mucilaginibacter phenanthrenivorans TaxID=1234842 RepID=UPI0021587F65|nr:serine/threonine-protein kinase [Mucilaginibacter phenanthrenivorans]MCR8558119.1 serine/threonine protein kinase [Mucilaginibacter phenanthrenivorans]
MSKVFTITQGLENMGALRTGGQGSVYKGRRIGPIITAVKLLPTPIHSESADDKNYRNFLNEVEKLKKVNEIPNPNVVKILNSGITESGSFPFIEMEFIEGPDLEDLLKPPHEKIFTIKETIKLADQLACALSHCHKVGVKHGDIKSNNVKFNNSSGNYVLLDFGLSVMSDEQRRSSMRHAGAIEFMAPEQNEGKMLFQTDIYSFGVILYELLAGQVPFPLKDNGETARNAVMLSHMESDVPDLLELRRQHLPKEWPEREMQVPGWLLEMIATCLEKAPENRYANGTELHDIIADSSVKEVRVEVIKEVPAAVPPAPIMVQKSNLQNQPGTMRISTYAFAGLMILLAGFMAYSAYSLFRPAQTIIKPVTLTADTARIADSFRKAEEARIIAYRNKKRMTDSATRSTIGDIIRQQKADSSKTDTTNNQ